MTQQIFEFPEIENKTSRLLIGPVNSAGQAFRWAEAVNTHIDDASAHSFFHRREDGRYPVHYDIPRETYMRDKGWHAQWLDHVIATYTHVIIESNAPLFGPQPGRAIPDIEQLQAAGVKVGVLAHGSDVRLPSLHRIREPWAHFNYMDEDRVHSMEKKALQTLAAYRHHRGPVFVSTLGLLPFMPYASWLPLAVDVRAWHSDDPLLVTDRPIVAHTPSSDMKGSEHIDPVLAELDAEGVISYRRVQGVPRDEMPRVVGTSDIVIDQIGGADYGTAVCEAMAAGRLVVSHVPDDVREQVARRTGLELPVVQAVPPTLGETIRSIVKDRASGRELAREGETFATEVHDGRRSADALRSWLAS